MTRGQLIESLMQVPESRFSEIIKAMGGAPVRPGNKRQAAEILGGVHPRTVDRLVKAGKLRRIVVSPRLIRFDLNEVQALAEGRGPQP